MGWNHDPDAIHSHQSGEIQALTEKTTPVDADVVVIEDSEDSWAKKKVALSEIGTGGGGGGGASYAETIGDNSNTSFQVTHSLGTQDLVVQLWDLTGSDPVEATGDADSITVDDEDNITVAFSAPPATDSYRVVVLSDGGTSSGGENAPQPAWVEYLAAAPTPHAANDEFNDNTVDPAWVVVEDTSPNIVVSEGLDMLSVRHPGGDSAEEYHGVVRPFAPAGDFMLETCVRLLGVSQNHQGFGLVAADGTTYGAGGQMMTIWTLSNATVALESFQNWNDRLTVQNYNFRATSGLVFLRLSRAGNVWTAAASPDGVSWIAAPTISRSLTVSHVGFGYTTWGGSNPQVYSAEYFRVTE